MRRKEALLLLGLDKAVVTLTPEIINEAFRAAARANHPDGASKPGLDPAIDLRDSPQADMAALTSAKKTLLGDVVQRDFTCTLCGGGGKVRHGMGWRACVACKGTGERRP